MCARQPCLSQLWPHADVRCDRALSQVSKRTRLLDTTHAWRLLSQRTSLVGRVLAERANAGELNI